MVFLLQKKIQAQKSQIILSSLNQYCQLLWFQAHEKKKTEMALRYFLTFDCHDSSILPAKPAHQKNKENSITIFFPTKVLPSNPTYLSNYSAQPENRSS